MKKIIVAIFLIVGMCFFLFLNKSEEKRSFNEKHYQKLLCEELDGIVEFKLKDKTRVDCLTDKYAIEVDWAKNWAEGIGQSLYYAEMTGKKPAVALIIGEDDRRFLKRLNKVAGKVGITVMELEK